MIVYLAIWSLRLALLGLGGVSIVLAVQALRSGEQS